MHVVLLNHTLVLRGRLVGMFRSNTVAFFLFPSCFLGVKSLLSVTCKASWYSNQSLTVCLHNH